MPRSSEAFSSKTRSFINTGPVNMIRRFEGYVTHRTSANERRFCCFYSFRLWLCRYLFLFLEKGNYDWGGMLQMHRRSQNAPASTAIVLREPLCQKDTLAHFWKKKKKERVKKKCNCGIFRHIFLIYTCRKVALQLPGWLTSSLSLVDRTSACAASAARFNAKATRNKSDV